MHLVGLYTYGGICLMEIYCAELYHVSEDLLIKLCLSKTLNLEREVLSANILCLPAKEAL